MLGQHEPREEFVRQLESEISREARRRDRAAAAPSWLPSSRLKLALSVATVVIVSMAIGGGVVAAAYQAQRSEVSQVLTLSYETRVVSAQQTIENLRQQLQTIERQVAVGGATQADVVEARFKVAEAEVQLQVARLDYEELKRSGREPIDQASAPLVGGRDFLAERWKLRASVSAMALDLERTRLSTTQTRFSLGMANALDIERSRTRMVEIETSIDAYQKKLDIRQRFLKREFDAPMAELRVLEAEADQRRQALGPRIVLAQKDIGVTKTKAEIGAANMIDVKEAELRLMELQLELTKNDVELARIRKQIDLRRGR